MLLRSSDPLARILDFAADAILSIDHQQRILLFNQAAERIFGYTANEVSGQPLDMLLQDRLVQAHCARDPDLRGAFMPGERYEVRGRRKDGTGFPAEASISRAEVDGEMVFTFILRDVTQRMLADEQTKASLRNTETLLREIHHRVKNDFQVVSSILGLQSRTVADPETRALFRESQNRIHSMALLHESLYQSEHLSQVNIPDYIRELAAHLFHSYGVAPERIHLRTNLDRLALDLNAAVPCGLIVNELVSNSLKYAFPDGREGEIRIELSEWPGGVTRLVVADNGIGLRTDLNWTTTKSLGLRLVRTLAEQLGAKIEVISKPGTEIQLTFAAAA